MDKKIDYSKIYSPSRLGMFDWCPKQYHFSYLDPIYSRMKNELKRQPHNIWSFQTLGKAVHSAITLFYHLPAGQRTEENILEQLKETWRSEVRWNQNPPLGKWGGFESLEEERRAYREALTMLKNFFQIAEVEPEIKYLPSQDFLRSIEDYQRLIRPLSDEFDISGKFDLVIGNNGDSLQVIDFKTSKKEEADRFQLRFYKVLAEENFQKPVKKASFYFLRTGNKKEFDLEQEQTKEIKEEILGKIIAIKATENFEARPSKLCQFCLFRTFCPKKAEVEELIGDVREEETTDDLPF